MINQYRILNHLGQGAFATVMLCEDSKNRNLVAIKQMSKRFLKGRICGPKKTAYDCVVEELKVLQRLQHPNIIFLHEIIDDPNKDNLYLVTEYHSNGSLEAQLKKVNRNKASKELWCGLPSNHVRLYFIDMLKALYYCHKVIKVVHRDIKPDNIMLNHNFEAVLIDFGVSAIVEGQEKDELKNTIGTIIFYAPEMVEPMK